MANAGNPKLKVVVEHGEKIALGVAALLLVGYLLSSALGNKNDPGFNPTAYSYNFGPVNYLQLPISRKQLAGFARYDMIPGKAEMYSRLLYTTYSADPCPFDAASAGSIGCGSASSGFRRRSSSPSTVPKRR